MTDLRKILRFVWPYFRRYRFRLFAGILLGMLFGVSNAVFVWATKTLIGRMSPPAAIVETVATPASVSGPGHIVDRSEFDRIKSDLDRRVSGWADPWLPAVGRSIDWRQVVGGLLLFPLLAGLRGSIGYLGAYCMAWVSERVVNDLRVNVFKKLSGLSLEYFSDATTGDALTRVSGDTVTLQRCMSHGFSDLITEPFTIVAIAIALLLLDPQLTLAVVVFFPVVVVPVVVLGRKARRASRASRKVTVTQASQLVELLGGIRVIKAFGLEDRQIERFSRLSRDLLRNSLRGRKAKEQVNPIIETLAMLGIGLLVVYVSYQQASVEHMAGYLTGLVLLYTPVKKLAALHMMLEQTSVSVERIIHILAEQSSVQESPHPVRIPRFQHSIRFERVTFAYRDQPVLREVDLELRRGERVGVAGESGSGKSTLVNLMFRFYDPTHGAVRIDGHDLREVALADLSRLMALVSQEIVVFDLTIAENIACGRTGATREEIEAAAKAANAHEFILRLPEGYETRIGERGVTLSGGQRQRLSIARAFVRNAPILVLDEATASLDSAAEAEVQSAIERLEENRTVLCIAHRLSTLASMDRIVVLAEGRVVEQGAFADLLRQGGLFAAMAARQGIAP
ncbi:MAG: ABC transporter ATP-binding protein/permease [Verrucomicrobia bacterium]|nr:ABC transporter ATP-binding protein/permease [Verrucomicrobiota bacterium]